MAEFGKQRHIPIKDLQPGMIVKDNVMGRNKRILVNKGEILTQLHVEKLNKWEATNKPQGPALPRVNPKDMKEPIRHTEFQGGYKVSHFNPKGILVAGTTASGEVFPDVEQHPEKSKLFTKVMSKKSFSVGGSILESPLVRKRNLRSEIVELIEENHGLGGVLENKSAEMADEKELLNFRDLIAEENQKLESEK